VKAKTGIIRLSEVKLKGPVLRPKNWKFQVVGDVMDIVVETTFVPGPITVRSGEFRADPERLSVSNIKTNVLDASLGISGTLYAYLQGLEKGEVDLSGQVTPKEMKWLSDLLQLKLKTNVRVPFSISRSHLSWHKDRGTRFNGDLDVKGGPQISLDIFQDPRQLRVDRLLIRDETSQASMTLALMEGAMSLTFSGRLSERTLDKIFSGYPFQEGWVKGDFHAHIDLEQPMQSVVMGKIEGNHFSFPSLLRNRLR